MSDNSMSSGNSDEFSDCNKSASNDRENLNTNPEEISERGNTAVQTQFIDDDDINSDTENFKLSNELNNDYYRLSGSAQEYEYLSEAQTKLKSNVIRTIDFYEEKISSSRESLDQIGVRSTRQTSKIDLDQIPPLEEVDSSLRSYKRKTAKMADEKDKRLYDAHVNNYDAVEAVIRPKVTTIEGIAKKELLTEDDVATLESHQGWLDSQKNIIKLKLNSVNGALSALEGAKQQLNFYKLEEKWATLDASLNTCSTRVQNAFKKYQKDKEIVNREKMKLPPYKGGFVEFRTFANQFKTFCEGLGEAQKKFQLVNALEGKARDHVQGLIDEDRNFKTIWDELESEFGDEKRLINATISNFFNIPKPNDNITELESHFTQIKNKCSNVLALGLTVEQLLTHYYLINVPGQFRTELEVRLDKTKNSHSFSELSTAVKEITRAREHQSNQGQSNQTNAYLASQDFEINSAIGSVDTRNQKPFHRPSPKPEHFQNGGNYRGQRGGYNRGNYYNYGQRGNKKDKLCIFCNTGYHNSKYCTIAWGESARKICRDNGYCDACVTPTSSHPEQCVSWDKICGRCNTKGHAPATCDGKPHPGSSFLAKKSA